MDTDQILNALERNTGSFPRQAVQAAIDRREEITPELLRFLDDTVARAAELAIEDEAYFAHMYALYLLAQFRETRAYPLVVAFSRLDEEILENLAGDFITEDLSRVLASVCDGDTAPIEGLIEDSGVYDYVRDAALDALVVLVTEGDKDRDEVMAYIKSLFEGKLERSPSQIWNGLVSAANDLHPAEVFEHIETAFREGLADPSYISFKNVEEALGKDISYPLNDHREKNRRYISDTIKDMEHWECFNRPKPRTKDLPRIPSSNEAPLRSTKTSPNEPCPCGSGKKYKKCCGSVV